MLARDVFLWLSDTFGSYCLHSKWNSYTHSQFDAELAQETFLRIFDKSIWPPSTPNINPGDFVLWLTLESNVSHNSYSSLSNLKETLMTLRYNLIKEGVKKACTSVEKILKAIVMAKIGHFEL